jgi:hypothetical protein
MKILLNIQLTFPPELSNQLSAPQFIKGLSKSLKNTARGTMVWEISM